MADEWRTVSHNQRVSEISMESWISVVCHLNNDDFHGELPAIFWQTTEFSGSQDAFAQRYQVEAVDYAGRRECETFPVGVPHWHPLTV